MKYRAFRPGLAALLVGMTLLGVTWGTGQDAALAATRTLTINSYPVTGVPITLVVDGGAPEVVITVDIEHPDQGADVSLTAPETFEHRPFVAWWVDGPTSIHGAVRSEQQQDLLGGLWCAKYKLRSRVRRR